jgi:hypothetical protein
MEGEDPEERASKRLKVTDIAEGVNIEDQGIEEDQEGDNMAASATRRVLTPAQLFGNYIDRYYSRLYQADVKGVVGNDQYCYMHSNRLVSFSSTLSNRLR